ncbi:uncharacterized protein LOC135829815 [Sycon ciliatum]|uniref:uncharacterized protein LOC135829815 n=1 Tax=Sycon ciliatum TaxID=27933 RepID=UPI0031F62EC5
MKNVGALLQTCAAIADMADPVADLNIDQVLLPARTAAKDDRSLLAAGSDSSLYTNPPSTSCNLSFIEQSDVTAFAPAPLLPNMEPGLAQSARATHTQPTVQALARAAYSVAEPCLLYAGQMDILAGQTGPSSAASSHMQPMCLPMIQDLRPMHPAAVSSSFLPQTPTTLSHERVRYQMQTTDHTQAFPSSLFSAADRSLHVASTALHPGNQHHIKVDTQCRHVTSSLDLYGDSQVGMQVADWMAPVAVDQTHHDSFREGFLPRGTMVQSPLASGGRSEGLSDGLSQHSSANDSEEDLLIAAVAASLVDPCERGLASPDGRFTANTGQGFRETFTSANLSTSNEYHQAFRAPYRERLSSASSASSLSVISSTDYRSDPAATLGDLISDLIAVGPSVVVKPEQEETSVQNHPMHAMLKSSPPARPTRRRRRPSAAPSPEKVQREQLRRNERLATELRRENAALRREEKALRDKLEQVREKIILSNAGDQAISSAMAAALCPTVGKSEPE